MNTGYIVSLQISTLYLATTYSLGNPLQGITLQYTLEKLGTLVRDLMGIIGFRVSSVRVLPTYVLIRAALT